MNSTFATNRAHQLPSNKSFDIAAQWDDLQKAFLNSVASEWRAVVADVLANPRRGGRGLRRWIATLSIPGTALPESIPTQIIQVYLDDPEVLPLHNCEDCGLSVPVAPSWHGIDGDAARIYFPSCPVCGGRTGPSLLQADGEDAARIARIRRIPR